MDIAQKLGYISVLDSLKPVTAEEKSPMTTSQSDEKYRVVAPEAMHETFMSDSEEEGGTFSLLSFVWNSLFISSNQLHFPSAF